MQSFNWKSFYLLYRKARFSEETTNLKNRGGQTPAFLKLLAEGGLSHDEVKHQLHLIVHPFLMGGQQRAKAAQVRLEGVARIRAESDIDSSNDEINQVVSRSTRALAANRKELRTEWRTLLEKLFLQRLLRGSKDGGKESSLRNSLDSLASGVGGRETGSPPELTRPDLFSFALLGFNPKRKKNLSKWFSRFDDHLGKVCREQVHLLALDLNEEYSSFSATWQEVQVEMSSNILMSRGSLRSDSNKQQAVSDPTVINLYALEQEESAIEELLKGIDLSPLEHGEVADQTLRLLKAPIYGHGSASLSQTIEALSQALANKLKQRMSTSPEMLWPASFEASQTLVNERLSKASRGAGGMEQALWRFGDRRFAHVDGMAIGGGGLADTDLLDATSPGLGIGRFLSEVESHPTGVNRFVVHLSTVGATTKDLTIYREMLNAFRSWFENSALGNKKREDQTDGEWIDMIRKKLWMIYPDFSPHDHRKGVGKRIDFLAVQDFRQLESELSLEDHERFESLRKLVEHEYRGDDAAPSN